MDRPGVALYCFRSMRSDGSQGPSCDGLLPHTVPERVPCISVRFLGKPASKSGALQRCRVNRRVCYIRLQ